MTAITDTDELKGKKILIVGIARSGIAVAKFLCSKGSDIILTDGKSEAQLKDTLADLPASATVIAGQTPDVAKLAPDFLVVSPGVPLTAAPIQQALALNIPVIGEMELAYRFAAAPIVAITGTNGKTTTTTLIGEIFRKAGKKVCVGGNIGLPLVLEVEKYSREDVIVAEVSSFQLETIDRFRPKVSVILNVTPDHLDRHGTMENYMGAKARILENQEPGDYAVLNDDDLQVKELAVKSNGRVIFFSRRNKLEEGIFVEDGQIIAAFEGDSKRICSVKDIFIRGEHNLENALAAAAAAYMLGVSAEVIGAVLKTFRGVAHRMELVDEINGVQYVNDSKGTNPDASIKALEAYDEPIILLAGGRNKGSDFSQFAEKIKEKVTTLILLGECREEIREAALAKGFNHIFDADDLEEAVSIAAAHAKPGDIVLLSPACASWDMFSDFEERGNRFKQAVTNLRR